MALELIFVICSALIIILLLMTVRSQLVFLLRARLLSEESIWLELHRGEMADARGQFGLFKRYRRLPSYTAMTVKFWKTMGSFEREAGSIEQYYPLLK